MMIELVPRDVFNALVNDKHLSFVEASSARKGVIIIKLYKAEVICLPEVTVLPLPCWVL